jgi:hypothetical protein
VADPSARTKPGWQATAHDESSTWHTPPPPLDLPGPTCCVSESIEYNPILRLLPQGAIYDGFGD